MGTKIPEGSALDKYGKPTTDALKLLEGVQLPIAGFRGSGLAWMVDILSGVLTGGNHGGKVKILLMIFLDPKILVIYLLFLNQTFF